MIINIGLMQNELEDDLEKIHLAIGKEEPTNNKPLRKEFDGMLRIMKVLNLYV